MAALSTPKEASRPNMLTIDTEDNRAILQADSGLLSELGRESFGQQAQAIMDSQTVLEGLYASLNTIVTQFGALLNMQMASQLGSGAGMAGVPQTHGNIS
jgi:hypothetical protein